ncbi:MAG TPA: zf-HC2 domain-containing protein [Tepidisphaeraceae bacterium]|nr:zf-HC2 domain-containing protein [Tepidisphaeraceae bacterium]
MMRLLRDLRLLNLNCREATRLVSDALDRNLRVFEQAGLSAHLALCKNCRHFRSNLKFLEELIDAADLVSFSVSTDALPPEAKSRIGRGIDQLTRTSGDASGGGGGQITGSD